jgi:2-deoxy-D-gluconate 3-dehydrogenase
MSMLQDFDLTGKTALVTGCNKGIGKAMAVALVQASAYIIGLSASLPLKGSVVGREVHALNRKFHTYPVDLRLRASL